MRGLIGSGWRDPELYARLVGCGRAGLAWELLRRDPDYGVVLEGAPDRRGPIIVETDALATAKWGLHFR